MIENIFYTSALFALMSVLLMTIFEYEEVPKWISFTVTGILVLSLTVSFIALLILIWM